MSGIYIKGLEMPGVFCGADIVLYEGINGSAVPRKYKISANRVVSVPPHGRLIDEQWLKDAMITTLEALKKNPKMDRQEMHLIAAFDTLRAMLEDAPTIIPPDKGECEMTEDCPHCVFEKTEANCRGCFEGSHYRPKPITNADRIRSMTDEELAKFLDDVLTDGWNAWDYGSLKYPASDASWLEWLKQEATE